MGFWKWLLLSGKKAALSKLGKVYLATFIPLLAWIAWAPLELALVGILVWAAFWLLYAAHDYHSKFVKVHEQLKKELKETT